MGVCSACEQGAVMLPAVVAVEAITITTESPLVPTTCIERMYSVSSSGLSVRVACMRARRRLAPCAWCMQSVQCLVGAPRVGTWGKRPSLADGASFQSTCYLVYTLFLGTLRARLGWCVCPCDMTPASPHCALITAIASFDSKHVCIRTHCVRAHIVLFL